MQSTLAKNRSSSNWIVLACVLGAVAYLPILNNGFIADDYVILERVDILKTQPAYLYHVPPENFRFVSYVVFATLKALVGYQPSAFYAVNIGLHVANIVLLSRLLRLLTIDATAGLGCLLFAVSQAPQEAIMWLAAMNETSSVCFTLLTLLMWQKQRWFVSTLFYALALFSKESAVVIPLLLLLLDFAKKTRVPIQAYALLSVPTAGFVAIFLTTFSTNFMITNRFYAFEPQALGVLVKTLHRLVWPWLYIVLLLLSLKRKQFPSFHTFLFSLGCMVAVALPYMFIAYQAALPSRQLYLSSAILMSVLAVLLKPLERTTLLNVFVIAFVGFNIGYLWFRKDAQFEQRAAPTTQLVRELRQHAPQRTVVSNFPYPYPEIARAAAWVVPGWKPELILLSEPAGSCDDCWRLRWNTNYQSYDQIE